jgi:hypothetical protein
MEIPLIVQSVRRKLNIFQKHQYFRCPKNWYNRWIHSAQKVKASISRRHTGLTVWLLDSSPWLYPTTKSVLFFSAQIMDRFNGPQTSKKWRCR